MWFEFRIAVEGELEAKDEAEARMILRATVRRLGSLDIEELRALPDEDDEPDEDDLLGYVIGLGYDPHRFGT